MNALLLVLALAHPAGDDLAEKLRKLDPKVGVEGKSVRDDARDRIRAANLRESRAWRKIETREQWEAYRDARIAALRRSLGTFPDPPKDLKVRVTKTIEGEDFKIENIVFESRPGLLVTANLYLPVKTSDSMPGVLICHSHHRPKTQGELQDMGMTWARLGCAVLVMDQVGHGERRAHPFVGESSYPKKYRVSRQDYHFRYMTGMQLHTIGDSLIGWMVWDMMRGVDLLLQRGADKEKIILLGAVAGGGDPAAVLAAVDPRIKAAVPFNFGGPQPENVFPLPENAEDAFNYAGSGGWESTRNLRLSVRDGFLPWVIVGGIAPRKLVYAHEFAWDRDKDPVWTRLNRIYGFYGAADGIIAVKGRGSVRGRPPEATHCTNIGAVHRKQFHPAFERWFGIPVPDPEYSNRRSSSDLLCLTPDIKRAPLHEVAGAVARERLKKARERLAGLDREGRIQRLQEDWSQLMGDVLTIRQVSGGGNAADPDIKRIVLRVKDDAEIPLLWLRPTEVKFGAVVAVARGGKESFLKNRAEEIAYLLREGYAVCLPDLRGTGETKAGTYRGRRSGATGESSSELMVGRTLLGLRLRDLRAVLHFAGVGGRDPVALWGDSFAAVNEKDRNVRVPLEVDEPRISSPMGGILALFGALYEDGGVKAVYARGGLVSYESMFDDYFCWLPHDIIVPGAVTAGDLDDVAKALAPRPVRLDAQVDARNRRVTEDRGAMEGVRWLVNQLKR